MSQTRCFTLTGVKQGGKETFPYINIRIEEQRVNLNAAMLRALLLKSRKQTLIGHHRCRILINFKYRQVKREIFVRAR